MLRSRPSLACAALALLALNIGSAAAQPKTFEDAVQSVTLAVDPPQAKPGDKVTVRLTMKLNDGWHTYPTVQPSGSSSANKITFPDVPGLTWAGPLVEPPGAIETPDPEKAGQALREYKHEATWTRAAVVAPGAASPVTVKAQTRLLVCYETFCLPPRPRAYEAKLEITGVTPAQPAAPNGVRQPAAETMAAPPPTGSHAEGLEEIRKSLVFEGGATVAPTTGGGSGLFTLLGTAALWGWISLVTPCVFPMIPITVSFFLKKGEKAGTNPIGDALIYCATIVSVLGVSAFTLLSVFRALSVNPWMNLFLGGLFVFFALSLFGMYDITLPNWLSNFTGSREGSGGVVGTVFMALTFTIISFTCVAPFLGGFSGLIAQGNFSRFELLLAGLVFAAAFASPFFVLALFPRLLKGLPRAGTWMNGVKVVMGFLELAAAAVFFRTAELRFLPETRFFTYDAVLVLWIVNALFCGLYLLALYRLPHDEPAEHISPPRMLLALAFVGFAIYLTPALFTTNSGAKQRPSGTVFAWVDAFLLPESKPAEAGSKDGWSRDLPGVLARARLESARTGQPRFVFIDFTGLTCKNCRLNERNYFGRPDFVSHFSKFERIQLYTDGVPVELYESPPSTAERDAEAEANANFQKAAFRDEKLPLYVILEPIADGKTRVHGPYPESLINDPAAFLAFLRKPFESAPK